MLNMCDHMSHSELTVVHYVGQTRHRHIHRYIRDKGLGQMGENTFIEYGREGKGREGGGGV